MVRSQRSGSHTLKSLKPPIYVWFKWLSTFFPPSFLKRKIFYWSFQGHGTPTHDIVATNARMPTHTLKPTIHCTIDSWCFRNLGKLVDMENLIMFYRKEGFIMFQYVSHIYVYSVCIYIYISRKALKFGLIPVVPRLQHLFPKPVGWNLFTKDTSMFSVRITNSQIARICIYQKLREIEKSISTNIGKKSSICFMV